MLPSRYQSLRLFGLGRSVLVVDEIHAYDDYVRELIAALLEFQASQGGSAILLSATLPAAIRAEFVRAFARGTGAAGDDDPAPCYPRATLWSRGTIRADHVCGRADRARTVPVRFLPDCDSAVEVAATASEAGAAILYLRNTMRDAHEAHRELSARGLDPMLFHSQFTLFDRLKIERSILELFGPRATVEQRRGRILVATQVAEQSLDIDFDVVISDLAPIDLIIQRAGRLWRHTRPERTGVPELLVVSPAPIEEPDGDWYARLFRRGAYVYRHHGRLWLTARKLKQAGVIRSPKGLRGACRSGLRRCRGDSGRSGGPLLDRGRPRGCRRGLRPAERAEARQRLRPRRWVVGHRGAHADAARRRRADDATAGPDRGGRGGPLGAGRGRRRASRVAPERVNIARRRISDEAVPLELSEAARRAKAVWTRYDQEKLLVVLQEDAGSWLGAVSSEDRSPREVSYSKRSGLSLIARR